MLSRKILASKMTYSRDTGLFIWNNGDIAGTLDKGGYVIIKVNKKAYKAHRLAWLYEYREMPSGHIDHVNHDRTDNRIDNLRDVSQAENNKNQRMYHTNTSGVTGVTFQYGKWKTRINVDGKRICLGSFVEFSEAVNARKNAEVLYGYHENHGKDA